MPTLTIELPDFINIDLKEIKLLIEHQIHQMFPTLERNIADLQVYSYHVTGQNEFDKVTSLW